MCLELCDIELGNIALYGAVFLEKLTVTQQVKKNSQVFEVLTTVTMKFIVNVRALKNNLHNTTNKCIDIKIIFLHTISHDCYMFRSILIICRGLLKINKAYIKA
jgi:hypothetical protein